MGPGVAHSEGHCPIILANYCLVMLRFGSLALLLVLSACAASGSRNPFDGRGPVAKESASSSATYSVRAFNPSFNDVTIFATNAFGPGVRVRVGRLGTSEEQTFEFRMTTATREVRFEMVYFSGPTCFTQPILITPGDVLELLLPAEPRNELACR